jgi:hypothetical protein
MKLMGAKCAGHTKKTRKDTYFWLKTSWIQVKRERKTPLKEQDELWMEGWN